MPSKRSYSAAAGSRKKARASWRAKGTSAGWREAVPRSQQVTLRYCETVQLNPTAADAAVEYRFRANSVYDPDRTGTGHQPLYFDQLAGLYESYEVVGSKIRADFSATTALSCLVGVNRDNDTSTTYNNRTALMENPSSKFKVITNGDDHATTVEARWSAKKTFGPFYNRDDNEALVTTNPVNESDFVVWAINQYGSEDPGAVNVMVTIDYIVRFSERKEVAQS